MQGCQVDDRSRGAAVINDVLVPSPVQPPQQQPVFFPNMSNGMVLLLFFFMNFLLYFDRGAIAASLKTLEKNANNAGFGGITLSDFQSGVIGSAYICGYMLTSPLFADYASKNKPFRTMPLGLVLWILSSLATGLSTRFGLILMARAASGVGEASFLCVATTVLDAIAPPQDRSRWLAIYFSALPLGYAFGMGFTGTWIGHGFFGAYYTWRSVFFLEGILMIPLIIWCFSIKGPPSLRALDSSSDNAQDSVIDLPIKDQVALILSNPIYVFVVLGYSFQTFVVGGFSFFGDTFSENVFQKSQTAASLEFGFLTLFCGLVGTAAGGSLLDYLRRDIDPNDNASNVEMGLRILTSASAVSILASAAAFSYKSYFIFLLGAGIFQLMVWTCLSPVNACILWTMPLQYRPFAMSLSVLSIHVLGDAMSPTLIGALLTATHNNWFWSMRVVIFWVLASWACWIQAHRLSKRNVVEGEHERLIGVHSGSHVLERQTVPGLP